MTTHSYRTLSVILLVGLASVLAGCGSSPPARFYLLHSMGDLDRPTPRPAGEGCLTLGVGPVTLADYLDRLQIVTRATPNTLQIAEYDMWAERLDRNVSHVLADNLSSLLCTKTVKIYPWGGPVFADYRVEAQIRHLYGTIGGKAILEANWYLFTGDGKKLIATKNSIFTEPVEGQGYPALVSAESRTIFALSREIAEAIKAQK
jgi:uncharacterized protein